MNILHFAVTNYSKTVKLWFLGLGLTRVCTLPVAKECLLLSLRYCSVKPTCEQYSVRRLPFARLCDKDIYQFESILGKERIVTDTFALDGANTDWMKMYRGLSKLMLKPRSTEEVSEVMKYCSSQNLAVCPQGGNTGLVGGSVPVFDEIILNMSLMNKVFHMDDLTGVLQCQSGCVLEVIEEHVNQFGYIIPLDLGSKGSCQIGGNVATNAGGLRFLRYGSLHGNVLGLKVVLSSGEILDCMSTLRKDNTGYDLKQMFIGSEGTLGIITEVAIQCAPKPKSVIVAFLGCSSFDKVLKTYQAAKAMLSEILSSFEMMDHEALEPVEKFMNTKIPISHHSFYMLIEVSGCDAKHDEEKMHAFLEKMMAEGTVADGTVATSPSHVKQLWNVRNLVPVSHLREGYWYKYDFSLPLRECYDLVRDMRKRMHDSVIRTVGFGHIGDSSIHVTFVVPSPEVKILSQIEPYIYEWVARKKGSVSAEHGVGISNIHSLPYSKSQTVLLFMRKMKELLDPKNILNPYKLF